MDVDVPQKADLESVRYGDIEAAAAADRLIDRIRNPDDSMDVMIRGAEDPRHKAQTQAISLQVLASYVLRVIVSVKNDGFDEEREWRLYYVGDPTHPVKTRVSRGGVVPYLHMGVNMKESAASTVPATINELVVGPGHNQRGQIAAARELLKASGHSPDVVVPSRLSFTG